MNHESILVSPFSDVVIEDSVLTDMLTSYVEEKNTTIYSYEEEEMCIDKASYENSVILDPCAIISSNE